MWILCPRHLVFYVLDLFPHFDGDRQLEVSRKGIKERLFFWKVVCRKGLPGSSVVKNLPANAGDGGSIPGLGISPGGENDNPFQYCCLENSMDRGAWRATVHGVTESQTHWSCTHTCRKMYLFPQTHILMVVRLVRTLAEKPQNREDFVALIFGFQCCCSNKILIPST